MATFGAARSDAQITPFDPAYDRTSLLSQRAYYALMGLFVFIGFAVVGVCGFIATTPGFLYAVAQHYLAVMIGSVAVSIGGVVVLQIGMRRTGLALPLLGYAMVVCSIGFTTGLVLPFYDLPTIANAFVGTALIAALFTLLGASFPAFFARIQGVLVAALLGVLIFSVVGSLLGFGKGWLDYVVVLIFAGLIAWDTYRASKCAPTVKMAILNAVEIWLDLINIFLRILSIVGNRD